VPDRISLFLEKFPWIFFMDNQSEHQTSGTNKIEANSR
jgi:hypothetical protein